MDILGIRWYSWTERGDKVKTILVILAIIAALFILAFILLGTMAFKAAGAAMKEFEEWRG